MTGVSMFRTLRSRILLGFSVAVMATALIIAHFVQMETEKTVFAREEANALSVLKTAKLIVEEKHHSYLEYKDALILERKAELKHITEIAVNQIEWYYQQYKNGVLTQEESQYQAKEAIRRMRYDNGVGYVAIHDMELPVPRVIMHPTVPAIESEYASMPLFYSALESKENLLAVFVSLCLSQGSGYVEYRWPKPNKNGEQIATNKASHVQYFEPWGWGVVSGVYIDDIEHDAQIEFDEKIDELRAIFDSIQIAENGYVFVFNKDKKFIIHPILEGKTLDKVINPDTGNYLGDDILNASRTPLKPFRYRWNKKTEKKSERVFWKRVYVNHFEPLDWYISSSVYEDELATSAIALRKKVLLISCGCLIFSLFLALWISRSLIKPLLQLTTSAKVIEADGISGETTIPIEGTEETKTLGRCLRTMLYSVQTTLLEKEELFRELSNSRENLYITLESIAEGVIATDKNNCVSIMNPIAEKLTGWLLEDAFGKKLENIFCVTNQEGEKNVEENNGGVFSRYSILTSRYGEEYHIFKSVAPICASDGGVLGVVVVFRDVTKENAMQMEMLHGQKMEAIGQLAGGVAHDFNNMLAGILSSAEFIERSLDGNSKLKPFTQLIIESAERGSGLTEKLLAFSRKQPIARSLVPVNEIIRDMLVILESTIERRISIAINLTNENDFVLADYGQLYNAFLNLCINASHAMPEGGTISIDTKLVSLDKNHCEASSFDILPGEYFQIKISDTGVGIPRKDLNKIFDPFFTTKEQGKGTGLGLSSVIGIVQQCKGSITVLSEVGNGASFEVSLPTAEA